MFKILTLILYGMKAEEHYTYTFEEGINYFKGPNDSGKTEFYTFLDYMFGSSEKLCNKEWYHDTLDHAELSFEKDGIVFIITRYLNNINKNFFRYADEEIGEPIRNDEYRARLNLVFSHNQDVLKELRSFVEEDVSYRTFTAFNFLGENRQGLLQDFLDKASDIKYALKLPAILNYIFNKNLARIKQLKKREEYLKEQLEKFEKSEAQNEDVKGRINSQLQILGIKKVFSGTNGSDILCAIDELQLEVTKTESATKSRTISELEAIYTSIDEQIKRQINLENDHRAFELDNQKQKKILVKLEDLLAAEPAYDYLIQPVLTLTKDLNRSISFNKYLIQEHITKELKKQREKIKAQIITNKSRFKIYSVSDKARAITLIKEYLSHYQEDLNGEKLSEIKHELRQIREEIRILQNSNDTEKLNVLSDDITRLYKLSTDVSDLAEFDFRKNGFHIMYFKNGNILQPQIEETDENSEEQIKNYYTGSMARHTLMQLCGYLAFLRMLISENKYPLIPLLVVDHISKPFDIKNEKAIGKVLHGAYEGLQYSDLQIIIFDDKDASNLGISPNMSTDLIGKNKSGFNPFYYKPPKIILNVDNVNNKTEEHENTEKTIDKKPDIKHTDEP